MLHPTSVLRHALAAAGLGLLASACSDQPFDASPPASPPGAAASLSDSGEPPLISNAVKYRERGAKPGTGRSGSATLTARALLGKDGATSLEVTTGELDTSAPAPGTLARVQVKQFSPEGDSLRTLYYTFNYNNPQPGGYAAYVYRGLTRGVELQVQANVRDIDPLRTDVVTVTETVHLRPDLRVALSSPQTARVGTPVDITAVVYEGNGDVGARANCVLYADGAEVDRANGIWVDAGDAVSCAFTHTFQATGTKQLRVALEGVAPGDFEPANNTAARTIQISSAFAEYHALVQDRVSQVTYRTVSRWVHADWGGERTYEMVYRGASQTAQFFAVLPAPLSFPLTRVEVSQSTSGATVHSATLTDFEGDETGLGAAHCATRRLGAGTELRACSPIPASNYWTLFYVRRGGYVTYQSFQYTRYWYSNAPDYVYFYNDSGDAGSHGDPVTTIGPDYTFSIKLTDGDQSYAIQQTVEMGAPTRESTLIYQPAGEICWSDVDSNGFLSEGCTRGEAQVDERLGISNGYPN